ncbi:hypothetical protein A4X09_0g2081 [Tilletia walkeri]|uniref:Anaphase-promoting complex subunit 5 n=1 Tax=Tilletia walkeri TaxID=117179 RepID=A0A8X7NDY8_9BASI|nr:hypothetical protein A4X09_0g2081 [Tilletia walkeri]
MSQSLHSEVEVADLNLLQLNPQRPQPRQESPDEHLHDATDSSASNSDEELDDIENLQLGEFDAKKLTKQVRGWYLAEDGVKPSTRFIDSRYPVRKVSSIEAPPDLSQLFRKLAPSLPRHSDPIANGFDFVEDILKFSHRLKRVRFSCVQLSGIVMALWKDVMAHPTLSKEHAVPGTATNLLLSLVNAHLKEFRRCLCFHVSSSLVTRSRRRAHIQGCMEIKIKDVRRIVSESRKKFGMAHKIHSIAAGPPYLQDRPTMCVDALNQKFKALMAFASHEFHAGGMNLSKDFPDVRELVPLLAFLHYIDLNIYRTDPDQRKQYHQDGDIIIERDDDGNPDGSFNANGDDHRTQLGQQTGAGDGSADGEENGDGEGHGDGQRSEDMNADDDRDGANNAGVDAQDDTIGAGDVVQDDTDGDGDQENASHSVEHTVKTKIDTLIDTIETVTRSQWFDFRDVARFAKWRRNVRVHLSNWFTRVRANRYKPASPDFNVPLQHILILFSQAGYVTEAASIAEMLVVVYREAYERDPSNRTKRRNLCNALGALSIAMSSDQRYLVAAQAAEDGIQILTPLYEDSRDRSLVSLGALQVAYSSALLGLSQDNANDAQKLFLHFRAQMAARKAVSMLRAYSKAHDDSVTSYAGLARSVQAHMNATVAVSELLQELASKHDEVPLDNFGWKTVPDCCDELTVQDALFIHGCLPNSHDARLAFHLKFPEEVVQIYRDIGATGTKAYDPFLAEALDWKAGLPETTPEESLIAYEEGRKVYTQLAKTFPTHFDRQVARFHGDYAIRLRFAAQYDKSAEILAAAMEYQSSSLEPDSVMAIWRGYSMFSSLASLHALVLSQIDRHAEAFEQAEHAETVFYATEDETDPEGKVYLAEPIAVKGYAEWMLGRPRDALKTLRHSLTALQEYDAACVYRVKTEDEEEEEKCTHPPIYMLALGWKAGVEASLGYHERAMRHINEAVQQARLWEGSAETRLDSEKELDPIEQVLAHLLVIFAGILLGRQRFDEALEQICESLAVSYEGERCSPSTYKTAILLKARILEAIERPVEAAEYASKAKLLPGTGFMDKLQ